MITSTDLLIRISVVLLHHYFIFAQLLWWLFAFHLLMRGIKFKRSLTLLSWRSQRWQKKMSWIFGIQTPLNRQPSSIYNKHKWFMSPRQFCLINTFISYNLAIFFSNSRSMILFHYLFGKKIQYFVTDRVFSFKKMLLCR